MHAHYWFSSIHLSASLRYVNSPAVHSLGDRGRIALEGAQRDGDDFQRPAAPQSNPRNTSFNRAPGIAAAKPSKDPAFIRSAAASVAPQATSASDPPTLTRRTPSAASSATVIAGFITRT